MRLLVLCPDQATADWARTPICPGPPEMRLVPVVVGPDNTPVITDLDQARRLPELATLSAAAHGDKPGVLEAAEAALDVVAEQQRLIYNDYIAAGLNAAARKHWEDLMATGAYEWQSDFARKYVGQGREEGRAEGEARGEARGEAKALLMVLDSRGIELTAEQRNRITSCTDLDELDNWLNRAAAVASADELFG